MYSEQQQQQRQHRQSQRRFLMWCSFMGRDVNILASLPVAFKHTLRMEKDMKEDLLDDHIKENLQEVYNFAETLRLKLDDEAIGLKDAKDIKANRNISALAFCVMALCREVEKLRYNVEYDESEEEQNEKTDDIESGKQRHQRVRLEGLRKTLRENGSFEYSDVY